MQKANSAKNPSSAFDPWLLWIAFRRHWGWAMPLGFLFAAIAAFTVLVLFVPVYVATAVLKENQDFILDKSSASPSRRDLARGERQLIIHNYVLDPVLRDMSKTAPSLSDPLTAEREIRERLIIGNAGTDNLLTISYEDSDPAAAAEVCNAVVTSYLKQRKSQNDRRLGDIEQWLTVPIDDWRREVENKRQELAELTESSQGYNPFKPTIVMETDDSKLQMLRTELAQLEAEETVVRARLNAMAEMAKKQAEDELFEPDPLQLKPYVDSDPEVQRVRGRLSAIRSTLQRIELNQAQNFNISRYNGLKADEQQRVEELEAAENAAREEGKLALQSLLAKQAKMKVQLQEDGLKSELVNLKSRREAFQSEYDAEKSRIENLGGETADIFFAREDYEQAAAILHQLNNRLAILRTERGRSGNMQVVAPAQPPSWPKEEVPYKKICLAAFGGFLLPFAISVLLEFRYKRLTNASALEGNTELPVVGEIARIPSGARTEKSHRLFEESVDALRANLLFQLETVRTIVVTSSMPSEGKSSVASQLAISLAKATEETVLLIDADLRSPDQHELFGLELAPGLAGLMGGHAKIEEVVDKSLGDLVHVIPAGQLDANPHSLLTKKSVSALFERLNEEYQYIVVDTAPVLPAAESLSVAAAADVTLLCAMRDVSRVDHVARTERRLEASGANLIGTVFSGVPSREYAYRYGDYRYASRNFIESA